MKKLIIRGYYGRDNLGDELMKEIFIRSFSKPNIQLMIMNSSPEDLKQEYSIETPEELITGKIPGVKKTIKRLLTILSADLYVYGGGTIITDKHSYFHLAENSTYFLLRRLLGKPSLLISVGATKLKSKRGIFFAKSIIGFSSKAYIRDKDSYDFLMGLTNNSKKLVQSADMVLLAKDYLPLKNIASNNKQIGLCLMPYYGATYHDSTKDEKLLETLVRQIETIDNKIAGYNYILIPIQSGKNDQTDKLFCEKVYKRLKNKIRVQISEAQTNYEKIAELEKCETLISMRLHALMIAKMCGNKIFAINHNEKIQYFMKRYDTLANTVRFDCLENLADDFVNMQYSCDDDKLQEDYLLARENIRIIEKYLAVEDK